MAVFELPKSHGNRVWVSQKKTFPQTKARALSVPNKIILSWLYIWFVETSNWMYIFYQSICQYWKKHLKHPIKTSCHESCSKSFAAFWKSLNNPLYPSIMWPCGPRSSPPNHDQVASIAIHPWNLLNSGVGYKYARNFQLAVKLIRVNHVLWDMSINVIHIYNPPTRFGVHSLLFLCSIQKFGQNVQSKIPSPPNSKNLQNPKSKIPKIQNPKSPKSKIQNPQNPKSKLCT